MPELLEYRLPLLNNLPQRKRNSRPYIMKQLRGADIAWDKSQAPASLVAIRTLSSDKGALVLENSFRLLLSRWKRETSHISPLLKKVMHPDYQRIIGLGPVVIPLILRELEQRDGHWFWALDALTQGESPAAGASTLREARAKWLSWGRQEGHI